MLKSKTLPELILPTEQRMAELRNFLEDCDPTLKYEIVGLTDPCGPAIVYPEIEGIVGSDESRKGCEKINEIREGKGLKPLKIFLVGLEKDPSRVNDAEEEKVSSSSFRMRLLGRILKAPLKPFNSEDEMPYVIGLVGGSASGKTSVGKRLEKLGAAVIDCDQLGHRAYEPGTECLKKVVEEFGDGILGNDGKINRAELGKIVFQDKSKYNNSDFFSNFHFFPPRI